MRTLAAGVRVADRPVAIVTGAARRVGRAIALELARRGCDVVITWRTSEGEAAATCADLRDLGARAWAVRLDLDDAGACARIGDLLPREVSAVDVLVHNASTYDRTPIDALDAAAAARVMQANALSPLVVTAALASRLRASGLAGGASVIAMADIHAMGRPRKGFAAYSMSKAALVEMVRTLAVELAPRVRVNGVAPGVVAWPESGYESDEAAQQEYLKRVPLGRAGTPEDAARAVAWLALEAVYVTGEVIRLDGGRWLR